jgi:hypothetical protein
MFPGKLLFLVSLGVLLFTEQTYPAVIDCTEGADLVASRIRACKVDSATGPLTDVDPGSVYDTAAPFTIRLGPLTRWIAWSHVPVITVTRIPDPLRGLRSPGISLGPGSFFGGIGTDDSIEVRISDPGGTSEQFALIDDNAATGVPMGIQNVMFNPELEGRRASVFSTRQIGSKVYFCDQPGKGDPECDMEDAPAEPIPFDGFLGSRLYPPGSGSGDYRFQFSFRNRPADPSDSGGRERVAEHPDIFLLVAEVPEPSSLLLTISAFFALLCGRRCLKHS